RADPAEARQRDPRTGQELPGLNAGSMSLAGHGQSMSCPPGLHPYGRASPGMTLLKNRHLRTVVTALGATLLAAALGAPVAAAAPTADITLPAGFSATVFAASATAAVTGPDDIAQLGDKVFVGYQNGVGTMGEPAPSGQTKGTLVEYDRHGRQLGSW